MPSDFPDLQARLAESARYALMRRLLPAIRHNIAGALQPVGMMAAMLERRMKGVSPDLVQLGQNSQALNALSREAAATSLSLMSWLAPKDNELLAVGAAVEESLALMNTELSFRGFVIVNQAADSQLQLPRGVLRSVFTASLIALTDRTQDAATVVVSAAQSDGQIQLHIALQPGGNAALGGFSSRVSSYRSMGWDDVLALAQAEGASLSHDACSVQLRHTALPLQA